MEEVVALNGLYATLINVLIAVIIAFAVVFAFVVIMLTHQINVLLNNSSKKEREYEREVRKLQRDHKDELSEKEEENILLEARVSATEKERNYYRKQVCKPIYNMLVVMRFWDTENPVEVLAICQVVFSMRKIHVEALQEQLGRAVQYVNSHKADSLPDDYYELVLNVYDNLPEELKSVEGIEEVKEIYDARKAN